MKTRHIIAIGILSAIAVGLLAIGIKTGKGKPKVQQTTAYYEFDSYNYIGGNFTISGTPNKYKTGYEYDGAIFNTITGSYTITKDRQVYSCTLTSQYVIAEDGLDGTIYNTNQQQKTFLTFHNERKTIKQIQIIQTSVDKYEDSMDYPYYTWEFNFALRLIATDNTTEQGFVSSFRFEHVSEEDYWWEEQNTAYIWETIEIDNTIATFNNVYATGYNTAEGVASPVDIRGLMLNILTMPFTFITQAFDVTLWEGTAYEFHLAGFIKGMIAIATILFIIRLFTSGFSIIGNYTSSATNRRLKRSQTELNKSKTALNNRTNPNHKTRTSVNHNYNHKD